MSDELAAMAESLQAAIKQRDEAYAEVYKLKQEVKWQAFVVDGVEYPNPAAAAMAMLAERDKALAVKLDLLEACGELVEFCWPDGKWRGNVNMRGILDPVARVRFAVQRAEGAKP